MNRPVLQISRRALDQGGERVMKALILAGGSATRLRPFSRHMPKQLIPIANRAVLEYVLENVRKVGVTDVAVIVGDWAATMAEALGDGSRFGVRITYVRQDRPLGLAHCVRLARTFLGDDDFVMYLGDNMLPDGIGQIAAEFVAGTSAAQLMVHRVADPQAFGVTELDGSGRVLRLEEKPQRPRSDLAVVGVYFFTAAIHQAVDAVVPSARGELEITDAIQWLITQGAEVRATEYRGYWRDTGRVEDLLDCNRRMLEELVPSVEGEVEDSELHGPVSIAPGARVVRSRIVGPAVIGEGTLVEDCHIGPGTSIGRRCDLRGGSLADAIVVDGMSLPGPFDLHGALVGDCTLHAVGAGR
ncbi:glucose-1-phosphate thymidylyltransferase [Streptomyces sp. NPDC051567]|uniref:glucose-1-phosphate thymidylyltransferase n=1 Tax=Streptomyces sp. NPDC051567 TaxID=3365660 RepID=UPI00379E8D0A